MSFTFSAELARSLFPNWELVSSYQDPLGNIHVSLKLSPAGMRKLAVNGPYEFMDALSLDKEAMRRALEQKSRKRTGRYAPRALMRRDK